MYKINVSILYNTYLIVLYTGRQLPLCMHWKVVGSECHTNPTIRLVQRNTMSKNRETIAVGVVLHDIRVWPQPSLA